MVNRFLSIYLHNHLILNVFISYIEMLKPPWLMTAVFLGNSALVKMTSGLNNRI